MPRGQAIDIDALHAYLYRKSDRLHRIRIVQRQLAEELGITYFAVNRILAKMVQQDRIKKMSSDVKNVWTYVVEDPKSRSG